MTSSGLKRCTGFIFSVILISGMIFLLDVPSSPQNKINISKAPLNSSFVKYVSNTKSGGGEELSSGDHGLGFIPSPVDLSHLPELYARMKTVKVYKAFTSSYDLRDTGKLTPVRNQGTCGSCWSFGTFASLESCLLTSESWDFSENNLKNKSGFDLAACDGGNCLMSTAYLSRWSGPVSEDDDPYNPFSNSSPSGLTVRKHIQEVLLVPDRTGSTDNDYIKQAIIDYGAVATTMYMDESSAYYKSSTHSYYYSGTSESNHIVAIVGWDDNYSSSNFPTTPAGNGAFIVRNSWGTGWGESGYFYISYYDTTTGKNNAVFNGAEDTLNYNYIYQYDPLGFTGYTGYSSDTAWFANIFTAVSSDELTAVSFYTIGPGSTYTVYIYTGVSSDPNDGTLEESASGTISSAGYHTVALSGSVMLTAGAKFSVVVRITSPGMDAPIAIEWPVSGYSSGAKASSGQSYISSDGSSWLDVADYWANTNVCLKAFTTGDPVIISGGGGDSGSGSGSCFIATAAFGSPIEKHVRILREFRDRVLLQYDAGKAFVDFYYRSSPPIAGVIAENEGLAFATRLMLMPVIGSAYLVIRFGVFAALMMFAASVLVILFCGVILKKRLNRGVLI